MIRLVGIISLRCKQSYLALVTIVCLFLVYFFDIPRQFIVEKKFIEQPQYSKPWNYQTEQEDEQLLFDEEVNKVRLVQDPADEYIALCLAVKDQGPDLAEWLAHHYHHLSIRRFYIMDDGSTPPLSTFPLPIPPSAVTFQYFPRSSHKKWMQLYIYNQCIRQHGDKHTWMGFLDADEFLQIRSNETLSSMLYELDTNKTIGALAVNWQIHTSSGLLTRPQSVRKAFTTCLEDPDPEHGIEIGTDNEHVKTIVKTEFFKNMVNPHRIALKNGTVTIGENGDEVLGKAWRFPATKERIMLHHYSVKSKQEFEQKMQRSNGMNDPKGWEQWGKVHRWPSRKCEDMAFYKP